MAYQDVDVGTINGVGTLSASAEELVQSAHDVLLNGYGDVSVDAEELVQSVHDLELDGIGIVDVDAAGEARVSVSFTGSGNLDVSATRYVNISVTFNGTVSIDVEAEELIQSAQSILLNGYGYVKVCPTCVHIDEQVVFDGSGDINANGHRVISVGIPQIVGTSSVDVSAVESTMVGRDILFNGEGILRKWMYGTHTGRLSSELTGSGSLSVSANAVVSTRADFIGTATIPIVHGQNLVNAYPRICAGYGFVVVSANSKCFDIIIRWTNPRLDFSGCLVGMSTKAELDSNTLWDGGTIYE